MTGPILPPPRSVLDLEVSGAIATFSVPSEESDRPSIPVKFIQTHVSFQLDGSHQEKLLANLIPVREIFNIKDLGFEHIMQRDIDDGRVSTKLIPYLVSLKDGFPVKFFPPIIVVILPVTHTLEPEPSYPKVNNLEIDENGFRYRVQRSGQIGHEAFEFSQLEVNGAVQEYDYARLRVNTTKCKLVIVDGQHRAMALLALYRNLKGWPDNTKAIQPFYWRWSKQTIDNIDLSNIALPICICAFPNLAEGSGVQTTVAEACRAIFLALNKSARPVSTSRNLLLDDYDVIAHFMRHTLTCIKDTPATSPFSLRIHNIELDSEEDRTVLTSDVAISGVTHLYTTIERAMLLSSMPEGLTPPSQKFGKIRDLANLHRRLDSNNLLGTDLANATNRRQFTHSCLETLIASYEKRYEAYLLRLLREFAPFENMARASLSLYQDLSQNSEAEFKAMLFEGQGYLKTFQNYSEDFKTELEETFGHTAPPELREISDNFRGRLRQLGQVRDKFQGLRAEQYLKEIQSSTRFLIEMTNRLYDEVFTTIAFQVALLQTFVLAIEQRDLQRNTAISLGTPETDRSFDEYLDQLNRYFKPNTNQHCKSIASAFLGRVIGTFGSQDMGIESYDYCYRDMVIRGELKPDEWTRFRYILSEIWHPSDASLGEILVRLRKTCRERILKAVFNREREVYAVEHNQKVADIDPKVEHALAETVINKLIEGLETLLVQLDMNDLSSIRNGLTSA